MSFSVIVPVASNAQPDTTPPVDDGWQFVVVPVWFKMSIRRMYADPYGNVVAFVLVIFPRMMGGRSLRAIKGRVEIFP